MPILKSTLLAVIVMIAMNSSFLSPVSSNQTSIFLTEDEAIERIMSVEEIQRWNSEIGHKGNQLVIRKEQEPIAACTDIDCLWCFRLSEDLATYQSTFGIYCIDPQMHHISRINMVTEELEPVSVVTPLSVNRILKIIPKHMFGWMKWRDKNSKTIDIIIEWKTRHSEANKAIFSGIVNYTESSNRQTESSIRMVINVDTRIVILTETADKKQHNFDDEGSFRGKLQADLLTITGIWSKTGYKRIADFAIFDLYNDE